MTKSLTFLGRPFINNVNNVFCRKGAEHSYIWSSELILSCQCCQCTAFEDGQCQGDLRGQRETKSDAVTVLVGVAALLRGSAPPLLAKFQRADPNTASATRCRPAGSNALNCTQLFCFWELKCTIENTFTTNILTLILIFGIVIVIIALSGRGFVDLHWPQLSFSGGSDRSERCRAERCWSIHTNGFAV